MEIEMEVSDISNKRTKKGEKKTLKLVYDDGNGTKITTTIQGPKFAVSQIQNGLQINKPEEKVEMEISPTGQTKLSEKETELVKIATGDEDIEEVTVKKGKKKK